MSVAMIAITTRSSTSVNPCRRRGHAASRRVIIMNSMEMGKALAAVSYSTPLRFLVPFLFLGGLSVLSALGGRGALSDTLKTAGG